MKRKTTDSIDLNADNGCERDTELIFRIKEGDRSGFEELVDKYQKRILSCAYKITGDWHAAQDISQDVFISLIEKVDTYDPERSFFSWIYRIAVNRSIDYLRRQGRERRLLGNESLHPVREADAEELMVKAEMRKKVRNVLKKLPLKYRIALVLRDIENIPASRIAEILDLVPATARWRIFQARKLFRDIWNKEGADYGL